MYEGNQQPTQYEWKRSWVNEITVWVQQEHLLVPRTLVIVQVQTDALVAQTKTSGSRPSHAIAVTWKLLTVWTDLSSTYINQLWVRPWLEAWLRWLCCVGVQFATHVACVLDVPSLGHPVSDCTCSIRPRPLDSYPSNSPDVSEQSVTTISHRINPAISASVHPR